MLQDLDPGARLASARRALTSARARLDVPIQSRILLWIVIPLAIEVFAWSPLQLYDGSGLDPSWQSALEMATHAHLAYGTQAIFTFGPLGFLYVAVSGGMFTWYSGLAVLAFLYTVLSRFALAFAVFHGARRSFDTLWAAVIAITTLRVGQFADLPVFLIAFIWALDASASRRARQTICLVGAAAAGFEVLEKVSIGATAAVLVVVVVASLPEQRLRTGAQALAAFIGTLIAAWLVAGQPLSSLPDYVHAAEQISAGYSSAMQVPAVGWQTGAALFAGFVGLWGASQTTVGAGRRQRVGIVLLWLCFALSAYKEGFVRPDAGHVPIYFAGILSGLLAFRWGPQRRAACLIAITAVACILLAVTGGQPNTLWRIDLGVKTAVSNAKDVLSSSRLSAFTASGRASVEQVDQVPERALALLRGHTVDVFPTELAIAWAYRLDWRPIPVLQSYSAYTPWLDRYDANFLRSSQAPSRILLQAGYGSIDGRILSYDEPETTVTMFCSYRPLLETESYAVLGRTSDRCNSKHPIGTVHADWNQTVDVPTAGHDRIVLVDISGVQVGTFEALGGLLSQAAIRTITLNGSATPNRLLQSTAADGLPLQTGPGLDYPSPFETTLDVKTLAVGKEGQLPTGSKPITYRFYSMTVQPWPHRRR